MGHLEVLATVNKIQGRKNTPYLTQQDLREKIKELQKYKKFNYQSPIYQRMYHKTFDIIKDLFYNPKRNNKKI